VRIEHRGRVPAVPESAYVAPSATLCGNGVPRGTSMREIMARQSAFYGAQPRSEPNQGAAYGPRRAGAHSRGALVVSRSRTAAGATPVVRACRIAAFQSRGATRIRFPSGSAARKVSPNPAS
jgi:hypothetical protein